MGRKKEGTAMIDDMESILRHRSASAEELAELLYGEDMPHTRRAVVEMVSRLKGRRGVAVESIIMYRVRGTA